MKIYDTVSILIQRNIDIYPSAHAAIQYLMISLSTPTIYQYRNSILLFTVNDLICLIVNRNKLSGYTGSVFPVSTYIHTVTTHLLQLFSDSPIGSNVVDSPLRYYSKTMDKTSFSTVCTVTEYIYIKQICFLVLRRFKFHIHYKYNTDLLKTSAFFLLSSTIRAPCTEIDWCRYNIFLFKVYF